MDGALVAVKDSGHMSKGRCGWIENQSLDCLFEGLQASSCPPPPSVDSKLSAEAASVPSWGTNAKDRLMCISTKETQTK